MPDSMTPLRPRTAIVLVSDRGYIVPTIGVALAARQHTADPTVEVIVLLTDSPPEEVALLRGVTAPHRITVQAARMDGLREMGAEQYGPAHVSAATMGRLWIAELLDPAIDRFLYLDGDVDITGPLDPLLAMDVPRGGLLAAPDVTWLIRGNWGHLARSKLPYLQALGVAPDRYFNAGVLLAERAGFRAIGQAAREFFLRNPALCRCQDQSALNAVASGLRGELSLAWNYQTEFMVTADPRSWGVTPNIWHFTGFPKPWQARVFPWAEDGFGAAYRLGAALLSPAGMTAPIAAPAKLDEARRSRETLRSRITWLHGWRRFARARRVRAAMAAA